MALILNGINQSSGAGLNNPFTKVGLTIVPTTPGDVLTLDNNLTIYKASNDGNPEIQIGSSSSERLRIVPVYDTGAQSLNYVSFITETSSATADKGKMYFAPDGVTKLELNDSSAVVTGSMIVNGDSSVYSPVLSITDNKSSGYANVMSFFAPNAASGTLMSFGTSATRCSSWTWDNVLGKMAYQTYGNAFPFAFQGSEVQFAPVNASIFYNNTTYSSEIMRVDNATQSLAIGTTDLDGTPTIGKVTIKGTTANGSTNIIVGRDSNELNVFSVDTSGNVTSTGAVGQWVRTGTSLSPRTAGDVINMGGAKIFGASSAAGNLWLSPTSDSAKGRIIFGDLNTSCYNGSTNQWGFGTLTPTSGSFVDFKGTTGSVLFMPSGRLVVGEDTLGVNRPALSIVMPAVGYGGSFKNVMLMGGYASDTTNIYNNVNFGLIQLTATANNYAMYTCYNSNKIDVTHFGTRITGHGTIGTNSGDFFISTANNALPSTSFITTSAKKTALGFLQISPGSANIEPTCGLNVIDPSANGLITISGISNTPGGTSGIEFNYNKGVGNNTANIARIIGTVETGGGGNIQFQTASSAAASYTTQLTITRYGDLDLASGDFTLHGGIIEGIGADIIGTQNTKLTISVPSQGATTNDGKGMLFLADDGGTATTGGDGGNIELRTGAGKGTTGVGGSVILRTGLGASSSSLGADVFTDGEVDIWTNPTTLTNWSSFDAVGTNGTLDQEASIIHSGTYAAKLTNVGGDFKLIYQVVSSLTPADNYRFKVWARSGAATGQGQLLMLNDTPATATEVFNPSTVTWVAWTGVPPVDENIDLTSTYQEFTFSVDIPVPANGKITPCLIADGNSAGNIVYYDLVSLQKVTYTTGTNGSILFLVDNTASMYIDMIPGTSSRTPVIYGAGASVDSSSVGIVLGVDEEYTHAGSKLVSIRNHIGSSWGTEKFYVDKDGSYQGTGRKLGLQTADITAANDVTLGLGNYFDVTGATEMQRILGTGWTAGSQITLQFDSTPTVKHGTAAGSSYYGFKLAGAADFSATAGDTLTLIFDGAWWREISRTVI